MVVVVIGAGEPPGVDEDDLASIGGVGVGEDPDSLS